MVEFFAPWCGHCKSLKPAWEQAAKAMKGIVNVAAVDGDAHGSLAQEYQVQGFPTIKLMYADESGKVKAVDYSGGRDAKSIIGWAMDKAKALALKRIGEKASSGSASSGGRASGGGGGGGSDAGFYSGTDVVTLSEDDFADQVVNSNELWFVEFYAPWCGHCKNLKPVWIEAAGELKGKVNMGAVDCTVHQGVCSQFGVQGYPTIKFFGANKKKPEDYQGGRDTGSIISFGNTKFAAMAPAPEPVELASQEVFAKECLGDASAGVKPKRRCLLAFLPDLLDSKAAGRNRYISVLKQTAESFKGSPFSYLWVQGGAHPALEANLDVGGFGYPALVALYPSEKMYSTCKGAFAAGPVKEWVEAMRTTGAGAAPIHGSLASVSSITPWDGQDAKEEAVEEFSLDDIMGDDI